MRPDSPLRHAKHALRAFIALVVALVAIVLGRSAFVPVSWGQYGSYRAANVPQQMALSPMHGGNASCTTCHDTEPAALAAGPHATLSCESCHAPLAAHVQDDEKIADMPKRKSAELCLQCHSQLDARPSTHPQIVARQHLDEMGVEFTEESCFDCHSPHAPI
jgi:formate-dependent nitrite reductase cytochrome c552 subunit